MQPDTTVRSALALLAAGSLFVAGVALLTADSPVAGAAVQADFNGSAVTYNGEVAREDLTVRFRGQASGAREVVFVLVGSSGAVVAERGATDADGGFDRNVPLEGFDRALNPGRVQAFAMTPGNDGVFGAAGESPDSASDLVDFANDLAAQRLSQAQVVERLQRATVDVMGSDDLVSASEFALANADTRVTNLSSADAPTADARQFVPGDVVVVSGVTNRRPDQNAVDVSVRQGPSADEFEAPIVDDWGTDGVWSVEIPVPPDARPGNYTVRASDGDSTDTVSFEVVSQQAGPAEPAANETTEPEPTETTTAEPVETTTEPGPTETTTEPGPTETTTESEPTETTTESEPTGTTTGQPGFGLLVGLASVAVALVVRRRLLDP